MSTGPLCHRRCGMFINVDLTTSLEFHDTYVKTSVFIRHHVIKRNVTAWTHNVFFWLGYYQTTSVYIDSLVQDCSNSSALAIGSLQSCTEPSIYKDLNMGSILGSTCNSTVYTVLWVNTLRPRQDGRLFPDDIFKSIFFNENVQISIKISLTFVPKAPINNIPALVQIMAWRRPGAKPLSETMVVRLLTHICVTRPQWVKNKDFPPKVPVLVPMDTPYKAQ